jgi:hypothetical protein
MVLTTCIELPNRNTEAVSSNAAVSSVLVKQGVLQTALGFCYPVKYQVT